MRSLHVRIVFQSLNNPLFEGLLQYWKINLSFFPEPASYLGIVLNFGFFDKEVKVTFYILFLSVEICGIWCLLVLY